MAERYNPGRFKGLVPDKPHTSRKNKPEKKNRGSRFPEIPFNFEEKSEFDLKLNSVYQAGTSQVSELVTPLKILQAMQRQQF